MELCKTCKKSKCNKSILVIKEENIVITKCLDYEKDETKIIGYKKPIERTAKFKSTLMGFSNSSWS